MQRYVLFVFIIILLFFGVVGCEKSKDDASTDKTKTENVLVAGTGVNQTLVRVLAAGFMQANPGIKVDVPDSIGSGGGIKEVTAKRIDIARIARKLKDTEKQAGLVYKEFAVSPVVFAAGKDIRVENVRRTAIFKIYRGTITNWKEVGGADRTIMVIAREPGDSSLSVIEAALGELQYNDQIITLAAKDQEMIDLLKNNGNAVGFGTLSNIKKEGLHILSLDGRQPDAADYPLNNRFAFVYWEAELTSAARQFIEFAFSQAGEKIIKQEYCFSIR